jgi:hypothetical protein
MESAGSTATTHLDLHGLFFWLFWEINSFRKFLMLETNKREEAL